MTNGWRRMTETAKQKWGMSLEKHFKATCNSRNEAMFREATRFAAHLRTVEKDLNTWQKDLETTFTNMRTIMLAPLPRVYEEGHNQVAVPAEPEPSMIGGDVQVERLTSASQDLKKRLDSEVVQPIKQWMVAYRTIQERMARLEALRLELDSRRRTVSDLQGRVERLRANLGTTRAKGEADMEVTMRKMAHKEDKMQRTQTQYHEMEQTVYNSLFTLIKDTCVLRDYVAAAILILQEAFQSGYAAFEPTGAYSTNSIPVVNAYGVSGVAASDNKYMANSTANSDKFSQDSKAAPAHGQAVKSKPLIPAKQEMMSGPSGGGYKPAAVADDRPGKPYTDQTYDYSADLPAAPTHLVGQQGSQSAYPPMGADARYNQQWAQPQAY